MSDLCILELNVFDRKRMISPVWAYLISSSSRMSRPFQNLEPMSLSFSEVPFEAAIDFPIFLTHSSQSSSDFNRNSNVRLTPFRRTLVDLSVFAYSNILLSLPLFTTSASHLSKHSEPLGTSS